MLPEPWRAQQRDGTIRFAVALAWALAIGGLMYGGAKLLNMPAEDLAAIAVMGGLGAAIFVFFFAGG